jgi:Na+-translocating ferredoxin:NAD+ oxidoreductase RnfE subunit
VAALVVGAAAYVSTQTGVIDTGLPPIVVGLGASAVAMLVGGFAGSREKREMLEQIEALHAPD